MIRFHLSICPDRLNLTRKGSAEAAFLVDLDFELYFSSVLFIEALVQYMTLLAVMFIEYVISVCYVSICVVIELAFLYLFQLLANSNQPLLPANIGPPHVNVYIYIHIYICI